MIHTDEELYRSVLHGVRSLVHAQASPRGTLSVSPEVAALLAMPIAEKPTAPAAAPQADPFAAEPPAAPAAAEAEEPGDLRRAALEALAAEVAACTKCGLCKTRTQTVFSDGDPYADICFVGEAPGADEDREGVPFVGRAGQLLTGIVEKGIKVPRGTVYICNVLKCRPPENRDPNPDEVHHCEPYLKRQLAIVRPKAIVALGRHAAQTLLKTTETTGKLRGKWHRYEGIPLRVTYHPAYLLRSPSEKAKTWEDIKEVIRFLEELARKEA